MYHMNLLYKLACKPQQINLDTKCKFAWNFKSSQSMKYYAYKANQTCWDKAEIFKAKWSYAKIN